MALGNGLAPSIFIGACGMRGCSEIPQLPIGEASEKDINVMVEYKELLKGTLLFASLSSGDCISTILWAARG